MNATLRRGELCSSCQLLPSKLCSMFIVHSYQYVSSQVLSSTFGRFTFRYEKIGICARARARSTSATTIRPILLLFITWIDFNSFRKLYPYRRIVSHSWSLMISDDVGSEMIDTYNYSHARCSCTLSFVSYLVGHRQWCRKIWINKSEIF